MPTVNGKMLTPTGVVDARDCGKPSPFGGLERHRHKVTTFFKHEHYLLLRSRAAEAGLPMTEFVRQLVIRELETLEKR